MIKIILTGIPLSTQNLYGYTCRGAFARRYMRTEKKLIKASYAKEAREQYKGKMLEGNVGLEILYFVRDKRCRDVDNYSKAILDVLEGLLYENDEQVRPLVQDMFLDRENPRIEIRVIESCKVKYAK